jgi:hypothetical protein
MALLLITSLPSFTPQPVHYFASFNALRLAGSAGIYTKVLFSKEIWHQTDLPLERKRTSQQRVPDSLQNITILASTVASSRGYSQTGPI